MEFFSKSTVEDVLSHRRAHGKVEVVDVSAYSTIAEVLETLNRHNILSVPVYAHVGSFMGTGMSDSVVDKKNDKEYIGIASILDICHYLFHSGFKSVLNVSINQTLGQTVESGSLWVTVPTTPLLEVMEPLSKSVHRLLVAVRSASGDNVEYHLLTQTDIVRFLFDNLHKHLYNEYPFLKTLCLLDLGLVPQRKHQRSSSAAHPYTRKTNDVTTRGQKKMISIWDSTLVTDALKILCSQTSGLYNKHLNSLPIVDPIGDRVVGTFSVSDLKSLTIEKLEKLQDMTIGNYLRWIYNIASFEDLPSPKTCLRSWTVEQVMQSLLERPVVHRLWIIESESEFKQNEQQRSSSSDMDEDSDDEEFVEVELTKGKIYQTQALRVANSRNKQPERLCGVISMTDVIRLFWKIGLPSEHHLHKHNVSFA